MCRHLFFRDRKSALPFFPSTLLFHPSSTDFVTVFIVIHGKVEQVSSHVHLESGFKKRISIMNKCARCGKTVYPTEELKCLDKVCLLSLFGVVVNVNDCLNTLNVSCGIKSASNAMNAGWLFP